MTVGRGRRATLSKKLLAKAKCFSAAKENSKTWGRRAVHLTPHSGERREEGCVGDYQRKSVLPQGRNASVVIPAVRKEKERQARSWVYLGRGFKWMGRPRTMR